MARRLKKAGQKIEESHHASDAGLSGEYVPVAIDCIGSIHIQIRLALHSNCNQGREAD
jgi:hypothetical protein